MNQCMHCFITGQVQGVWFRASTQTKAQQLGLTGWARNLADGRVEVLACGNSQQLELLYQWLHQGPELARVDDVAADFVSWQEFPDFQII